MRCSLFKFWILFLFLILYSGCFLEHPITGVITSDDLFSKSKKENREELLFLAGASAVVSVSDDSKSEKFFPDIEPSTFIATETSLFRILTSELSNQGVPTGASLLNLGQYVHSRITMDSKNRRIFLQANLSEGANFRCTIYEVNLEGDIQSTLVSQLGNTPCIGIYYDPIGEEAFYISYNASQGQLRKINSAGIDSLVTNLSLITSDIKTTANFIYISHSSGVSKVDRLNPAGTSPAGVSGNIRSLSKNNSTFVFGGFTSIPDYFPNATTGDFQFPTVYPFDYAPAVSFSWNGNLTLYLASSSAIFLFSDRETALRSGFTGITSIAHYRPN